MIRYHDRSNAVLDQPLHLRYALCNQQGELTDPPRLDSVRITTRRDDDKQFDAQRDVLYTFTAKRIQRICTGIYEVVLPVGICRKEQRYFDQYHSRCRYIASVSSSFVMQRSAPALLGYCSVQQLRSQAGQLEDDSDSSINAAIAHASQFIDRWTDRFFVPSRCTFFISGHNSYHLPLPQPLLNLERLQPVYGGTNPLSASHTHDHTDATDETSILPPAISSLARNWDNPYLLANKHLPAGHNNIAIQGLFGTTNEQGNPPAAIVQATIRLAIRYLCSSASNGPPPGPLVSETTDGHSYQLAVTTAAQHACFSGDPDIDAVVRAFQRPVAAAVLSA